METTPSNRAVITDTTRSPNARLKPVALDTIRLGAGFWQPRLELNHRVTLFTQHALLESTGRLDNFRRVSGEIYGSYRGLVFNDSDVYKWLEAAAWTMAYTEDDQLIELVDQVIELIIQAQDKDGYLHSYFSLDRAAERWNDLRTKHELYCAGHLIQAAVAHYRVTGKTGLLEAAIRFADHIYITFGPTGREGTCGHPEIEMALIELYRESRQEKYLQMAANFLDRRGRGLLGRSEYLLDHLPFRDLQFLAGHAVRGLYLCSGAADLFMETGEVSLRSTLERLWENMTTQQMYVTGGAGARHDGEAFGTPYELPNSRAYAETCAAIANIFWNWRMAQIDGNPRYIDLLEWTLYNAVLPGSGANGQEYFYVNPLQDDGTSRRQAWFECACCPPNLSRMLAMLPGMLYSVSEEGIWINLYAASTARIPISTGVVVEITQTCNYPWEGRISIRIESVCHTDADAEIGQGVEFSLFVRIPAWLGSEHAKVNLNDQPYPTCGTPGSYLAIRRRWKAADTLEIDLPMKAIYLESHPRVVENSGKMAVTYGPIVYCLEQVDNPGIQFTDVMVDPSMQAQVDYRADLLNGVNTLRIKGLVHSADPAWEGRLYRQREIPRHTTPVKMDALLFIPYFSWANRIPGAMQVWCKYIQAGL